jgi:hypothetical protein
MCDQSIAIRQAAGAYVVGDTGSHDLLGSAAADTKQEFDSGPVNERAGKDLKVPGNLADSAIPERFCRHR